jgi:hypothetical protein
MTAGEIDTVAPVEPSAGTIEALQNMAADIAATGRHIANAFTEYLPTVAADIAAGRTPESLPTPGHSHDGRRLANTARHMARHHAGTPEALEAIWYTFTAAIWADDELRDRAALDRLKLYSGPDNYRAPHRSPRDLPAAPSPLRGLEIPEAGNAPPARPCTHTPKGAAAA